MSSPARGEEEDSKAAVMHLFVTIKVVSEERMVRHTMRMTDRLQAVMDVWYHKVPDITYGTGKFLFNGCRVRGDSTPAELEMEDGDMIDFFEDLLGGCMSA